MKLVNFVWTPRAGDWYTRFFSKSRQPSGSVVIAHLASMTASKTSKVLYRLSTSVLPLMDAITFWKISRLGILT